MFAARDPWRRGGAAPARPRHGAQRLDRRRSSERAVLLLPSAAAEELLPPAGGATRKPSVVGRTCWTEQGDALPCWKLRDLLHPL